MATIKEQIFISELVDTWIQNEIDNGDRDILDWKFKRHGDIIEIIFEEAEEDDE